MPLFSWYDSSYKYLHVDVPLLEKYQVQILSWTPSLITTSPQCNAILNLSGPTTRVYWEQTAEETELAAHWKSSTLWSHHREEVFAHMEMPFTFQKQL